MATSTPANANSPPNISPVGPPPATATACSAIGLRPPISPLSYPQVLAWASDSAARPGSCRKPPGALYVESGRGTTLSLVRYPCPARNTGSRRTSTLPVDPRPDLRVDLVGLGLRRVRSRRPRATH